MRIQNQKFQKQFLEPKILWANIILGQALFLIYELVLLLRKKLKLLSIKLSMSSSKELSKIFFTWIRYYLKVLML
ncbi:MAG: hypothetical protein ACJAVG_000087 [Rickettsiales bacterium]|jgi:hypothetical protein